MDFLSHDGFRSAVKIPFPITGNLIHHLIHLSNDLHLFFIGFNEQFSSSSGYYKEGIPSLPWGRGEFESIHPCGLYHIRRGVYSQTNALNEIIAKSLLFGYYFISSILVLGFSKTLEHLNLFVVSMLLKVTIMNA